MSSCNCNCKDRKFNGKWCDNNEAQDDIKRAGDIVKDSEQCDIIPNTEKGIFLLWCRLREIILTICDIFKRMKRLQEKMKYICEVHKCINSKLGEMTAKPAVAKENIDIIRRYGKKEPNSNDAQAVYNEALSYYNTQVARYESAKRRLEEMRNDSTKYEVDDIIMTGRHNHARAGSFDYYSGLALATTKSGVEYPVGGISFGSNRAVDFVGGDLHPGAYTILRNVGITSSGRAIHMKVTFTSMELSSHASTRGAYGEKEWLSVKSENGAVSIRIGNFYRVSGTFDFLDDSGAPINLLTVNVVNDIDYKQGFFVYYNNSRTIYYNPTDSGIVRKGKYVGAKDSYDAKNESSIPKGSLVFAGIGSSLEWDIIANDPGVTYIDGDNDGDASWIMSFFGNYFKGEVVDLHEPQKPVKPEPPKELCSLTDCNFDCLGDN